MIGVEQTYQLPLGIAKRLPEFRAKYGQDLYWIPVYGMVFRPFTRGEVVQYEMQDPSAQIYAQIHLVRAHTIHPELDTIADSISLAGLRAIFDAMLSASGFRNPESFNRDLNRMRLLVHQRDHAIIRMICSAFPSYKIADIDCMPRAEILYLLAQSEARLGYTIDGVSMEDMMPALEMAMARMAAKSGKRSHFFDWIGDLEKMNELDDVDPSKFRKQRG